MRIARFPGLLLASLAARAAPPARGPATEVFADAAADPGDADGSRERPFSTLALALAAAAPGAIVRIAPGVYRGPLTVEREVTLAGPGAYRARIVAGQGEVALRLRARAVVEGIALEGGRIGVWIEGGEGHLLRGLALRGQEEAAIQSDGAAARVEECEFVALAERAHGLHAVRGRMETRGCVFRGAGRRSLHFEGARGEATDNDIEGAGLVGLSATAGAEVVARGNRIGGCGGAALFAVRSHITASDNELHTSDYGFLTGPDTVAKVRGNFVHDHREAGLALVASSGELRDNRVRSGGRRGGISVAGGDAPVLIAGNALASPGRVGIHLNGANVQLRGNVVEGATAGADGDFGHGVYALESRVEATSNLFRGNAGAGIVVTNSAATLRDNRSLDNRAEGVLLLHRARVHLTRNQLSANGTAGLFVGDGARARLLDNRFRANTGWGIYADCRTGGRATLEDGNTFEGNGAGESRLCP